MSFDEYMKKEIAYIEWFSRYRKISINEACSLWVEQGLAELFAHKYRDLIISAQSQQSFSKIIS